MKRSVPGLADIFEGQGNPWVSEKDQIKARTTVLTVIPDLDMPPVDTSLTRLEKDKARCLALKQELLRQKGQACTLRKSLMSLDMMREIVRRESLEKDRLRSTVVQTIVDNGAEMDQFTKATFGLVRPNRVIEKPRSDFRDIADALRVKPVRKINPLNRFRAQNSLKAYRFVNTKKGLKV